MNHAPILPHRAADESATPHRSVTAYDKTSRLQIAMKWFRHRMGGRSDGSIKELIEEALEEQENNGGVNITAEEKNLLKNMIHFGELNVRDIMTPRSEIMALPIDVGFEQLKRHVIDIGHTRIPVFAESLDRVEGFLHVKDLFPHLVENQPFDISKTLREILFVPPSMRIADLLLKMRVSGCHIAIVVDEYGGTSGLVTMEDLFEEIVGEIQDEHDEVESQRLIRRIGPDVLEVDARLKIDQLEEALGETVNLDGEDDFDSVGGFIFSTLGRVPVKGEVLKFNSHYKCEILSADPRRIKTVRITRLAEHPMHEPVVTHIA